MKPSGVPDGDDAKKSKSVVATSVSFPYDTKLLEKARLEARNPSKSPNQAKDKDKV